MPRQRWPLAEAIKRLRKHYGSTPTWPSTDPFDLVLWESCAYLVDDLHRAKVYARLVRATGGRPAQIAGMQAQALARIIEKDGGMSPLMRAEKLQRAANLVLEWGQDELRRLCEEEPERASKLLKQWPGISGPGVDRILMIAGSRRTLAPESNGLRVLVRLGFGVLNTRYEKTYASVAEATAPELPKTPEGLIQAHLLLRRHGKTLCKTARPHCEDCPLSAQCPSAR